LISDTLKRLLDLVRTETSTEDLQKPPYESYAQLVQEINNRLSIGGNVLDKELLESMRNMVREALASLVRRRIEKIMRYYQVGKDIPQELLFIEVCELHTA